MPIYAYRCTACGLSKDVLQKVSDPVLTLCPGCGEHGLVKQLTAAGFQLKGSGWYVTDFRDGNKAAPRKTEGDAAADSPAAKPADAPADKASEKVADKPAAKTGEAAAATAPAATSSAPSTPTPPALGS